MSPLKHPTIQGAVRSTFLQRAVAFTAMVLLVSVVLFWPNIRDGVGTAIAQNASPDYQPFACGQSNVGTAGNYNWTTVSNVFQNDVQKRRQSLALKNGSGGIPSGGARAFPCVSGVQWKLSVGCTTCTADAGGTGAGRIIGIINNAFSLTGQTLYFAGNGSASGLSQVSIQGLQFCKSNGYVEDGTATGTANSSCKAPVSGISLSANSSTSGSYTPATPYQLNINPAAGIVVGGSGMMADIWGTGTSAFEVPSANITSQNTGCSSVQGVTSTNGCTVTLSQFGGSLANALAGGSILPLVGVNLTFYYLITHSPGATDPYTEGATKNSMILPNTRIYVGNGS